MIYNSVNIPDNNELSLEQSPFPTTTGNTTSSFGSASLPDGDEGDQYLFCVMAGYVTSSGTYAMFGGEVVVTANNCALEPVLVGRTPLSTNINAYIITRTSNAAASVSLNITRPTSTAGRNIVYHFWKMN